MQRRQRGPQKIPGAVTLRSKKKRALFVALGLVPDGAHSVLKGTQRLYSKLGRWKAVIGFPVSSPSALIKR